MLDAGSTAKTAVNQRTLFWLFLILVSFILLDVAVSSLVDEYKAITNTFTGKSIFVLLNCVLITGTYFLLKTAANKMRAQNNNAQGHKIANVVWVVYYVMVAIMAYVMFQLFVYSNSEYHTAVLAIAPTISYGLGIFVLSLLSYRLISWFRRNRDLVVLMYGIACISACLFLGLTVLIFNNQIITHHVIKNKETFTTAESGNYFPLLSKDEIFWVSTLSQILTATTFLSFWGSTISILHASIRRIGNKTFWVLVTTPIILFLITLIFWFPEYQNVLPEKLPDDLIFTVTMTNFSQVGAIALFAIAFAVMGRAIRQHHRSVSDYMYFSCYGFALFSIAMIATVSGAGYPPFGLPSVSLVGPFSFLLFIGLNHSAIVTAADSKLRRSILISARQQFKLLDSIGTSEWERKLENKVLEITKSNVINLKQQSGIEPSVTMDETKQYIYEVLQELKNRNNLNDSSYPG